MIRTSFTHILIAGTVGLAALSGCQPKNPAPTPDPAGVAVGPSAVQTQPAGVAGRADINGQPFAGAIVKIYRPGETTPIATTTTGPDGRFTATVGVIATGGGNVIATGGGNVIATGGGNVIATGGGNVIATGGGNVIATGGGNLIASGAPLKVVTSKEGQTLAGLGTAGVIATGGGNVIATGGGNVIATGGGNVIATGGGNFHVQAANREAVVSLASTLALYKLGDKLDQVLKSAFSGGDIDNKALDDVLASYDKFEEAAEQALEDASPDDIAAITQVIDDQGTVQAPTNVTAQLDDLNQELETAFKELEAALEQVADQQPTTPDTDPSPDTNVPEPTDEPPAPSTDSGGGGNNEIREDNTNSSGNVTFGGHFYPPYQRPNTSSPSPGMNFYIFTDQFENGWTKSFTPMSNLSPVTTIQGDPLAIYDPNAPIQHGTRALRFESTAGDTSSVSFDLIDSAASTAGATFTAMHLLYTPIPGVEMNIQAIDINGSPSNSQPISAYLPQSPVMNGPYFVYNIPFSSFNIAPSSINRFRFTPASNDGSGITIFLDDIRYY